MPGLKSHISFCFVDDHPIFLDVARDRYLTLPPDTAQLFLFWVKAQGQGQHPSLPVELLKTDLFDENAANCTPCIALPVRRTVAATQTSLQNTLSLATAFIGQRQDRRALSVRLATLKPPHKGRPSREAVDVDARIGSIERDLIHCRRFLSSTDQCLADAFAIADTLRSCNLPAKLVFGVRLPFAAHCWVQVQDIVVGDTIERIRPFTPIHVA